jgi:hypothetical protein
MNKLTQSYNSLRCGRLTALLLAVIFSVTALRAQPTEQTVQSRFLFIFDTSKSMKPRVEAVEKCLNTMLATSLRGQSHTGDSMAVWTVGQSLQTKGYPLQSWNPDAAVSIASNLVKYVDAQRYTKSTQLDALQPMLNRVVRDSERLTVLIFCDGESKISGTPYDDAIAQVLKAKSLEQKQADQPLVIVLRSQLGQYAGCTANLPPQPVNIPDFPPLPLPPAPLPKPTRTPPPMPVVLGQPLIIIGKKPPASMPPPVTNQPPVVVPVALVVPTNELAPPTNPAALKLVELTTTNLLAVVPESSGSGSQGSLLVGAGLLGAAIALGLVFWLRPHRKDTSLITRSLDDRK